MVKTYAIWSTAERRADAKVDLSLRRHDFPVE